MCFTRFIKHPLTAWLFGALVQAAFAEEAEDAVQPNTAVPILVPQVDPANTNVVTGIAVSYPAASTTPKSSTSSINSINSEEEYETEVPSLYTTTTTITTTSTKTGTETVESSVSRSLTSSSSLSLPPEANSAATVTKRAPDTTSTNSSGNKHFIPSAWRSYQSAHFNKSTATTKKTTTTSETEVGSNTHTPCSDFPILPPKDIDVGNKNDSWSDRETPSMMNVFGAAALAMVVQAGMVFGGGVAR
ncbi:hypothetical protein B0H65DRAFT_571752 [Neurospora tetraspora]|uniref:Uncharacterized protein n=1 Tax=Neurospora tetraspora TaxID=94610 RepID=A0AAE0JHU6_9PEZI|nr:hypothetical protein B0H65DRAFT_571752 [Neurospora tetraspora]